jgi:hypothetical protein
VRRLLIAPLVAGLCVSLAAAQSLSVEQIVAKNVEAKGGLERIKSVETIKQTGTVTMAGMQVPLTLYAKRPNMVRQEMTVQGKTILNGFDGRVAWILNPLVSPMAAVVAGPQAEQIRADSSFDGPLIEYEAQGYTVRLESPAEEDGRKLIHLRLVAKTGRVTHVYLDASTFLDVKHTSESDQLKLEQRFEDYRTVSGFKAPFVTRTVVNGVTQSEMRLDKIEFNVPVEDAFFRLPR